MLGPNSSERRIAYSASDKTSARRRRAGSVSVRTTGSLLLLRCGTAAAVGEVSIPVVGQPSPFYGAAGSGVKIETIASPVELAIDDSLLFTIRVSKLVNADDVQRPDLSAIDE